YIFVHLAATPDVSTRFLHDALPISVGQAALFHDLEEHVVDVAVGLLDLVEEDHRVGAAADLLGELAAFLVADVAGRGADQAGGVDRKSTRLNSSHVKISYAVFCLKK